MLRGISIIPLPFGQINVGRCIALIVSIDHVLDDSHLALSRAIPRRLRTHRSPQAYAAIIVSMLLSVDAPKFTFHFTDDVAFRAAWTTVSQIPLVYLLSAKHGPLSYLTGLSYERINWLHKCVGRMIFVSATTHMAIMLSSISIPEVFRSSEESMQVVRYGIGAYTLLLWIAVSSIIGVRKRWYRFFYINHWMSTVVFLGLAFNHVPNYARLPIFASMLIVASDKALVAFRFLLVNVTIRPIRTKFKRFRRSQTQNEEVHVLAMGHPLKMVAPIIQGVSTGSGESTVLVRICDLPFKWNAGQHVRMWLPRLGTLEVHPFTPATCSDLSDERKPDQQDAEEHGLLPTESTTQANEMILMIKAHQGLTKRLADYRDEWRCLPCPNASQPSSSLVAFIDGPYGNAPAWEDYENLVMFSTSTGVSFMLSILNYLEQLCFANKGRLRTRQIRFVWTNRHIEPVFEATVTELLCRNSVALRDIGIVVEADFYVTCTHSEEGLLTAGMHVVDPFAHLRGFRGRSLVGKPPLRIRNPNDPDDWDSDNESTHTFQNSPSTTDDESRRSEDTCVEEQTDEERPCLSDLDPIKDEGTASWWSKIELLRWTGKGRSLPSACHCGILRHQERKCNERKAQQFILRHYGTRPAAAAILNDSVPSTNLAKTMVTICGGKQGKEVRNAVSKINIDYGMARRESGVHFWTEGTS